MSLLQKYLHSLPRATSFFFHKENFVCHSTTEKFLTKNAAHRQSKVYFLLWDVFCDESYVEEMFNKHNASVEKII